MARPKVGEILVRAGLIDEMQLRAALGDQSNWGQRLGITLVKMGLVEERDLMRALAQQLKLPVVELEGKRLQPEVLDLVAVDFAEKHLCVPLFIKGEGAQKTLYVGMEDPANLSAIDELGFRSGLRVQPVLVAPSELCEAIDRYYHRKDARSIALPEESASDLPFVDPPRAGIDREPAIQESLFRDLSQLEVEPPAISAAPAATAPAPAPRGSEDTHESTNRTILRALCQLLIEKQVIDRRELHELVRALQERISASQD